MLTNKKGNTWMYLAMAILFTITCIASGGCGGSSSLVSNPSDPGDGNNEDDGSDETPALEFEYGDVYTIAIEFNGNNVLNFEYQPLETESTNDVPTAANMWQIMTATSGKGHFVYIGGTGFLASTETFSHELTIEGSEVSLQVSNSDGSTQARIDINVQERTYEVTFIENGQPKQDAHFNPDDGLKVNDEPVELHNPEPEPDDGDGDDNVDPDPVNPDPGEPGDDDGGDDNNDPDHNPSPNPNPDPDPDPDPDPTPDPDPDPDPTPTPDPDPTPSPSPTKYTVSFNTAGGSSVDSQTIIAGGKATKPTDPTWNGYRFDGWYADEGYKSEYKFDSSVTANITIYAKWTQLLKITSLMKESVGSLTFYSDSERTKAITTAAEGTKVYVKATPAVETYVCQSLLKPTADETGWELTKMVAVYIDSQNHETYVEVAEDTQENCYSFTMPGKAVNVQAAFGEQYAYLDHSVSDGAVTTTNPKVPVGYMSVTNTSQLSSKSLPDGFYVLQSNLEFTARISIGGDVKLLLLDESKITADRGISVTGNNSLTIYAQSTGDNAGQLTALGGTGNGAAGIGGLSEESAPGEIIIHGGVIDAIGGAGMGDDGIYRAGAGIGGSGYKDGGKVTIYDGVITATGGATEYSRVAAGIGGGNDGDGGTVTIYGGTVTTTGGIEGTTTGEGIGHGASDGSPSSGTLKVGTGLVVYISDTDPSATNIQQVAGLAYYVRSRYMTVTKAPTALTTTITAWADGTTYAVPTGGLTYSDAVTVTGDVTLVLTDSETLTLNKGISLAEGVTLTVQGTGKMAVNGTDNGPDSTVTGTGTLVLTSGTLTVKGGNGASLNITGQDDTTGASGGVAINGNVIVNNGTLTATGGNGGNFSGLSENSKGGAGGIAISGSVTINSGIMTATGGNGGNVNADSSIKGSGGGNGGTAIGGNLTWNGGALTATTGTNGTSNNSHCPAGTGGVPTAGTVTDNRSS